MKSDWIDELRALSNKPAVKLQQRLDRIAQAHSKEVVEGGLTSGNCNECNWSHPCPTYTWATTDRDSLAVWNPDDDAEAEDDPSENHPINCTCIYCTPGA